MTYLKRDPLTERVAAAVEDAALRQHIEQSLYPEYVECLDVVKRAIVLCAGCRFQARVPVAGEEVEAAVLVAVLDLEAFVIARARARLN